MDNYFKNKTTYQDLIDLRSKIIEYDNLLLDFKAIESNEAIDFYKQFASGEFDWSRYYEVFELNKYSHLYELPDYLSCLSEKEIDRLEDSVGYAQQIKRKRRALIELQSKLDKNIKKLKSIQRQILKSIFKNNVKHDYKQDLKKVLRRHMPLVVDEDDISSKVLQRSFNFVNDVKKLIIKNIKSSKKWIKLKYSLSFKISLNRKIYLLRTEHH